MPELPSILACCTALHSTCSSRGTTTANTGHTFAMAIKPLLASSTLPAVASGATCICLYYMAPVTMYNFCYRLSCVLLLVGPVPSVRTPQGLLPCIASNRSCKAFCYCWPVTQWNSNIQPTVQFSHSSPITLYIRPTSPGTAENSLHAIVQRAMQQAFRAQRYSAGEGITRNVDLWQLSVHMPHFGV